MDLKIEPIGIINLKGNNLKVKSIEADNDSLIDIKLKNEI